jgi:carbon monoxide dehydrogenase subunit G
MDIARQPSEVFAYLTDITRLPEWQSGVVEARWETQQGPGARAKQVRDFRGSRSESELQVTAYEPDRRFALTTLSGPVSLSLECTLEPSGSGTRLNVSGEGEPSGGLAKVAGPIVARKIAGQFKNDFETLKQNLESGS